MSKEKYPDDHDQYNKVRHHSKTRVDNCMALPNPSIARAGGGPPGQAEVLWPDGTVQTLTNLQADRYYKVRQGDSITH